MKKFYSLLFFTFLVVQAFSQTTVSFTSDRDNTLYSQNNNTSNGAGDQFFAGATAAGALRRGLIHFNLSSIPTNAVVTAATLKITCTKTAAGTAGITVHKVSNNWGEGSSDASGNEGGGDAATTNDATWANRFHPSTPWSSPGGDFVASASASQSPVNIGNVSLSGSGIIADVQAFITSSATNYGWLVKGTGESGSQNARRFATRENPSASDRPTLTVTYTITTPVSLSKFTATSSGANALLKWQTVSEVNSHYFEIEHSRDGNKFSPIGQVQAAGSSSVEKNYSFTHENVSGKNFYRLVQYDKDGSKQYSPVVVLSTGKYAEVDIYPNPAQNYLQIKAPFLTDKAEYRVINYSGQLLLQGVLKSPQLSIEKLPAGQYSLSILSPEGDWLSSLFFKR